jgi:hypothetical protein
MTKTWALLRILAGVGVLPVTVLAQIAPVHDSFDYEYTEDVGTGEPTHRLDGLQVIYPDAPLGYLEWNSTYNPDPPPALYFDFRVANDNLSVAGLAASVGNSVILRGNSTANADVCRIGTGGQVFGSGTLYYSLILKVTDMFGLAETCNGVFVAGFNNREPESIVDLTRASARLSFRKLTGETGYQIGVRVDRGTSCPSATDVVWDNNAHYLDETVHVVAAMEFVTPPSGDPLDDPGTDDIHKLWINPSPDAFGNDLLEPTPTLTATGGDASQLQIQSFFLRQLLSGPRKTIVDEVRVGTSWGDVTPTGPIVYEGFEHTPGEDLGGLYDKYLHLLWGVVDPTPESYGDATIATGSLDAAAKGLPAAEGNSLKLIADPATNGTVDRIQVGPGTPSPEVYAGKLYYSLILKVTNFGGLTDAADGVFIAGFNGLKPTTTTEINAASARLQVRRTNAISPAEYQLGVRAEEFGGVSSAIGWDPVNTFLQDDEVFVVVGYEFHNGVLGSPDPGTDDVAKIWVNPDPTGAEPAPTATSTGSDTNAGVIRSFFLRQVLSGPEETLVDELRIGTTWDHVTKFIHGDPWVPPGPTCSADLRFDIDQDLDVDQYDFAVYQLCHTGTGGAFEPGYPCQCMNADGNTWIDGDDFFYFKACASGSNVPADAACDDGLPPP